MLKVKDCNNQNHNDFLVFQIKRGLFYIMKNYLNTLEEFKEDNLISQEYFDKARKRILSDTNNKLREIEEIIQDLNIELKKK